MSNINKGGIISSPSKNLGYTIVPNIKIDNQGKDGLKGLGLYHYLLSRKALKGFTFSRLGIKAELACGDRILTTSMNYLKEKGLLQILPIKDDLTQQYLGHDWKILIPKDSKYSHILNDAISHKLSLEAIGLFCFINLQSDAFKKNINQTQLAYKLGIQTKTIRGYLKELKLCGLAEYNSSNYEWSFKSYSRGKYTFRVKLFKHYGANYPIAPYKLLDEMDYEIIGSLVFDNKGHICIVGEYGTTGNKYQQKLATYQAEDAYYHIEQYIASDDYKQQVKLMGVSDIFEYHLNIACSL